MAAYWPERISQREKWGIQALKVLLCSDWSVSESLERHLVDVENTSLTNWWILLHWPETSVSLPISPPIVYYLSFLFIHFFLFILFSISSCLFNILILAIFLITFFISFFDSLLNIFSFEYQSEYLFFIVSLSLS